MVINFRWRSCNGFHPEDFVIEKFMNTDNFTEKSLQFVALILGGRAARAKLLEFYVSRGVGEEVAESAIKGQLQKVRKIVLPSGVLLIACGMYIHGLSASPVISVCTSISIYLGLFLLACQLPRQVKPTASWDALKDSWKSKKEM